MHVCDFCNDMIPVYAAYIKWLYCEAIVPSNVSKLEMSPTYSLNDCALNTSNKDRSHYKNLRLEI